MSAIAIFMMLLTIILVWGGLVASVVLLKVLPDAWAGTGAVEVSLE